jgi:RNA-binding protein 26
MVNDYFQRFGTIVNITVQPEMQRARIEFSSHEEANNAYTSPDVIFENRFVKVYWDHEDLPTASVVRPAVTTPRPGNPAAARNEAFQKKQEALKGMLELQKQKQELLLKYISQQKELLAKLESKALPEGEKQEILKTLKGIDDLIKSLNLSSISSEESSSLKKSTDMIIDTPEQGSSTPESSQPVTPILRGGPLMRGRGGGMVRGRGGAFASREAHRLDLRPTAFLMKPVPSRVGRDIGSIRKLYEPYGEIKNITLCDDQSGVIVSFSKRADAEKAYFYMPKADLGEPFELEWIASALSQSSPALSSISVPGDVSLGITDTSAMPEHIAFEEEGADDSHWKR